MTHHCHALLCKAPCQPRMLMCRACWSKVPGALQEEVYRTVKLRGKHIDSTWAPWWRAQAQAIDHVARSTYPDAAERLDRILKQEIDFADSLEQRDASSAQEQ